MKLFFYDLETTGVKHWKHSIHQLSGCIDIDGVIKEEFNYKIKPHPKALVDDEVLSIGRVTREQIEAYPDMSTVHAQLCAMLSKYVDKYNKQDKLFLAGYNNRQFDDQFLRSFFLLNGDNYFGSWFWSDSHDVMVLASKYLAGTRHKMEDFKLATVAAALGFGVDTDKTHDAVYDIHLTRQIYYGIDL